MTCAKAHVRAVLIPVGNGPRFTGTNACRNPQRVCPRIEAGHGRNEYSLCSLICQQEGHAEIQALKAAGPWAVGSTVFVNHHRVCRDCSEAMERAGVARVVLGEAP